MLRKQRSGFSLTAVFPILAAQAVAAALQGSVFSVSRNLSGAVLAANWARCQVDDDEEQIT